MNSGITVGDKEFSISDIQKPVDEILEARKSVDTSQMQAMLATNATISSASLHYDFPLTRIICEHICTTEICKKKKS